MQRFPRTATNLITLVTFIAWLVALALGQAEQGAPYALGFIPLRVEVPNLGFPALPVFITPLTATTGSREHCSYRLQPPDPALVRNSGRAGSRDHGADCPLRGWGLRGRGDAMGRHSARERADDWRERSDRRGRWLLCAELRTGKSLHEQSRRQSLDQRCLVDGRLDRASGNDGLAWQHPGSAARDSGARRGLRGRPIAAAALASLALPKSLIVAARFQSGIAILTTIIWHCVQRAEARA